MKRMLLNCAMLSLITTICFAQNTIQENRDLSRVIAKVEFDQLVDTSIDLLRTKELSEISDADHRNIMMCLNTIQMAHDPTTKKRFANGRYKRLEQIADEVDYTKGVIQVYSEWSPNRGMGFYFPALQIELYGTPSPYAWFHVKE